MDYDLAVIGGGAAGLTASRTAIRLGLKVALIEKERLGGDCTWAGCVPSKALLAVAKRAYTARESGHYGIHVSDVRVDFPAVMSHLHTVIHEIYAEETPDVLRSEGVDVYETLAEFADSHTLALADGKRITAKKFVICTGSTAVVPGVFKNVPHLTNKTVFHLKELPKRLIVLGGGPIGTELAQAFQRLGSQVTVIDQESRLLPRDDPEAAQAVMEQLQREGVELRLGVAAESANTIGDQIQLHLKDGSTVQGDQLLLALGRRAHVESLKLQNAGVELDQQGKLILKDTLQTTQPHIYAAGDVTGGYQFTHYAGTQAFTAVRNLLFPFSSKGILASVPWATYCDPEVGQAGLIESQAREQQGDRVRITRLPMSRSDRAMTEGKPDGFMKLIHLPNGKLLGATIVGVNAGDLVNEWAWIISKGGSISGASGKMRIYPAFNSVNGVLATENLKQRIKSGVLGTALRLATRLFNR
ncbi:MAG: FAD-dependent oxidoreductase [Anaerolineae bacterium]|jgi:pyruvate/2-oxoglutarate dehydrogenase complex dihydrolipoamide dehydrogenase (E3) component|nr:FAD-dependent oxidoreductase [Anaerolineae bacterium]